LSRFGRFWGLFTVLGMLALNGLTVVTEFIGISLALDQLGIERMWGVGIAAVLTIIAASTGEFRRFERFAMTLVLGSLLLIPVFVAIHPPMGQVAHDLFVPQMPAGRLSDIMLLIIAIVGTTVAPWQLFFQQSYVIDKRITPRFIPYEKIDLWLGIVIVIAGAIAMMGFAAATFAGRPEFGQFTDAGGVAAGLAKYAGHVPAVLFSIALLDASMIGTAAVSLSTAYAIGDLLAVRHSLNRKPGEAKLLNVAYAGLIAASACLVLLPGAPLGLITVGVQTLAGVLLPSATVFLLLLCNDRAVLGPWVNGRWLNLFTSAVIAVLVLLSVILTASVLFPDLSGGTMLMILAGGGVLILAGLGAQLVGSLRGPPAPARPSRARMAAWRMPPLEQLPPAQLGRTGRVWMVVMWGYLLIACAMVVLRVVQLGFGGG
jgi:Mn2+/Fe2+ NRAMP family transporter